MGNLDLSIRYTHAFMFKLIYLDAPTELTTTEAPLVLWVVQSDLGGALVFWGA